MEVANIRRTAAYDPRQELPFDVSSNTPEWRTLTRELPGIHKLLTEPLAMLKDDDSIQDLVKAIDDILHNPARVVVGVISSVGSGSSTTINSLLQLGRIASVSCGGRRTTIVTQEFCGQKRDQIEPFLADVFFYPPHDRFRVFLGFAIGYYGGVRCRFSGKSLNATVSMQSIAMVGRDDCGSRGENEGLTFTASNPEDLCSQLERHTTCMEYEIISSLATLVGGVRFHFSDPLIDIGVSFMEAPQSDEFSLLPSYRFDGITHSIIVEDCRCATDSSTSAVDVAKVRSLGDERAILALTKWDQIGMINKSDMGRATDI
ncbi:unnamed protein product [Zymoseptoria tritici ST99CH_1A5]|uniref:Uncharacterized protein n=1 Tax=Zymoseptoria tritici ST99CH_1A5 TaxID=1276529 RepID=A0A1Y6M1R5_ZYMTR|nr:unnamed protein product [Zymoseptoria tritici ST99CH_1A5]